MRVLPDRRRGVRHATAAGSGARSTPALRALFGDVGAVIVLIVAALGVTVWITNVSLKKVIGW